MDAFFLLFVSLAVSGRGVRWEKLRNVLFSFLSFSLDTKTMECLFSSADSSLRSLSSFWFAADIAADVVVVVCFNVLFS
jgi:hypothetical protein